jgi:hypothetical protein
MVKGPSMPSQKSSIKEIVINVLILAVAGGILAWRVNDCKQKEKEAAQRVAEGREAAEKTRQKREKDCLETVEEADRNDCIKCTCTSCIDAYESCYADKNCRTMSLDALLKDGGPPADDPGRIRFENRASCMLEKCGEACTGKK